MMKTAFLAGLAALASANAPAADPGRIGAAWQPVYGLPPAKAVRFVPALRTLGSGFARVTLYWTQLEPKPGVSRWDELDAYLAQIDRPDEAMITIASASPWATRVKAVVFPSSPARDAEIYAAFVRRVVVHCAGRVRYFQADTEPSSAFTWSGTAADYAAQQRVFYQAVKEADPKALVVLGGSDGLFDPSGTDPLPNQEATMVFLKTVIGEAQGSFDLFDLHLYADPYTIGDRVRFVRGLMRASGGEKPIIASEVSGPGLFEIKANRRYAAALLDPTGGAEAVRRLRQSIDALPIAARMFLDTHSSEARQRLLRIQGDDLMVRNVLALAAGIERTAWFDVWHDPADADAPRAIINSPTGLFEGTPQALAGPTALGAVFARVARALGSARSVDRLSVPGNSDVYAYRISRQHRPSLLVAWRRPATRGDVLTPATVTLPREAIGCAALVTDGTRIPADCSGRQVTLALTDQPVIVGSL